MQSLIKPKKPKGPGWKCVGPLPYNAGYESWVWDHYEKGIRVGSAVEVDHTDNIGPEYHISVSFQGRYRCSPELAEWAKKEFDMEGATEDNHVPGGFCRNYWKPVASKLIGKPCDCWDEETPMIEDKGSYIWRAQP
jgi:hypothetical protein